MKNTKIQSGDIILILSSCKYVEEWEDINSYFRIYIKRLGLQDEKLSSKHSCREEALLYNFLVSYKEVGVPYRKCFHTTGFSVSYISSNPTYTEVLKHILHYFSGYHTQNLLLPRWITI